MKIWKPCGILGVHSDNLQKNKKIAFEEIVIFFYTNV